MSIPIHYTMQDGRMFAAIQLPNGQTLGTSVDMAPVVGAVCDQVGATDYERLAAFEMVGGDVDIVGAICGEHDEVGGRRSRRRRRKARRKRVFGKIKRGLKKVAKPLVKAGKALAKSKLIKGLAKVVKKIPIYGQLVSAAAKGIKGAVKMGKKIARKVKKGKRPFRSLPPALKAATVVKTRKNLRLASAPGARARRPASRLAPSAPARRTRRARRGRRGPYEFNLSTGRRVRVELI